MELLISLMVAMSAYNQFASAPSPGTFAAVATVGGMLVMDTRTGTFERCTLVGDVVTCKPIATAAK